MKLLDEENIGVLAKLLTNIHARIEIENIYTKNNKTSKNKDLETLTNPFMFGN